MFVFGRGDAQRDAWRLPAPELEEKVSGLVRRMIGAPGFAAQLMPDAAAEQIGRATEAFSAIAGTKEAQPVLALIARIDIAPGRLDLKLDAEAIAEAIKADSGDLATDALTASFSFQLRKRGVETKIILAESPAGIDEALVRNIALAQAWFERIKEGETCSEIARTEATSKRRIQQMICLADLALNIVRDVMDGKQPVGFTFDWCLRHDLPSDWAQQRALISTL